MTKLNRRSQLITAGVARSPNRAMLRAVGFKDDDFEKPIVGVANGHSTMNPCNAGIQPLVDRVTEAIREAGAMPQVFGFPTVTDEIGMGTEGMKYSLVSREVIADSIEVAVQGQQMDGVVAVGGCDKNMPGSVMALARINVPESSCMPAPSSQASGKERSSQSSVRSKRWVRSLPVRCRGRLQGHRKERLSVGRCVRRPVHRKHNVLVVRSAWHEPARLIADGVARSREGQFRGRVCTCSG